MYILKEQIKKENRLTSGHRMCAGCGAPVIVNGVLRALNKITQLYQLQLVALKYLLAHTHTHHGKIVHLFIQHLNVHLLHYLVLKLCITNLKKMEK